MNQDNRFTRQQQIIPAEQLAAMKATVIGVGAIGRQVALQLAAIGVPWLQLIDHDTVEEVNLAPQGYLETDLGRPKVETTAEMCRRLNSQVELHVEQARFRRSMEIGNVVFCCVDKINTRRLIWDAVKDKVDFWADGRMSAEVLRVLTASDAASRKRYPTTLFAQEEAFVGACTARSTIFCSNIAAGLMVSQFAKWLRGLPIDCDLTLNLLANELNVQSTAPAG
jgi:sulfur carrier protein ThiS adenylyltransferase